MRNRQKSLNCYSFKDWYLFYKNSIGIAARMKILNLGLFALMALITTSQASQMEQFATHVEINITLYLDNLIMQAQEQGMNPDIGLCAVLKNMRNELGTKTLSEKLAESDIVSIGDQFYKDFCYTYQQVLTKSNGNQLTKDQCNALIYQELSPLFHYYFPEFVLPYPDLTEIFDANAHISPEEYKNIGYVVLYCLKQWVQDEKKLSELLSE